MIRRSFALLLPLALVLPAGAAERDICDGKQGPELIRCIEAAARLPQQPATTAPAQPAERSRPAPAPQAVPAPASVPEYRAPPEDCTGRVEEALSRCLAAGGRLSPSAVSPGVASPHSPAGMANRASCDGLAGEQLRRCVEAQAQAPQRQAVLPQQEIIPCTGYTAADQPLCLHRNSALAQCRNRQKYPDFDVCMRSFMSRAPDPGNADCQKLQARTRGHCEARNRVYRGCTADKINYFSCLESHLGPDAVLTRKER